MAKIFRIQLSEKELMIIRNLLASQYHCDRRNLYWTKYRVAHGQSDSRVYPIEERQEYLKFQIHLLKKLSRHVNVKWFEQ